MLGEQPAAVRCLHLLALRLEEGRHRRLGVDDEHPVTGQAHHHIGAHPTSVATGPRHLGLEVAAIEHPRVLEDPPQLHFPPRPPGRRCIERPGQCRGLPPEARRLVLDPREHLADRPELLDAVPLEHPDLALDPPERVPKRRQQRGGLEILGQ